MSDDPATFARKNEAQIAKITRQLADVGRLFISHMAAELITTTAGFGNQMPEDTEYIPTGRLRGGWSWSLEANPVASRWEGGPYSDYGEETHAAIDAQLAGMGHNLPRISYLQNDVAYGYIVHEGLGRHVTPRPWVKKVQTDQAIYARRAIHEVFGL